MRTGDIEFYDAWHQRCLTGENALKSRERRDLLRGLLETAQSRLLIVGCGGAGEMSVVPSGVKAVGIDISSVAVQQSRSCFPQFGYVIADAAQLPFRSSCGFRAVICSEVIEHVPRSDQALLEFNRIAEESGKLYLTTPNWYSFYGLARAAVRLLLGRDLTSGDQPYDRWSTKRELRIKLQGAGFTPREWLGIWFFPPFGRGNIRIPDRFLVPLLSLLMPIERRMRRLLPSLAHVICVISAKDREKRT